MYTTMYHLMSTEYSPNQVKTRLGVIPIVCEMSDY